MSFENKTGLNVHSSYGKRDTGGSAGSEATDGSTRDYSFNLTGESLASGFIPPVSIPKGSKFIGAKITVKEAFVVSTGGTVVISGVTTPANSLTLTEAELEALGTKSASGTGGGTWATNSATGTAASDLVKVAITGTVAATSGKANVTMTFFNKTT